MKKFSREELESLARSFNDSAYRRGYCHGYLIALENIEGKMSIDDGHKFVEEQLMKWRSQRVNELIGPPFYRKNINS